MQWTASQMIAILIERLGGGPVTVTLDEMKKFKSPLPCVFTAAEDQRSVTVEIGDKERLPGVVS